MKFRIKSNKERRIPINMELVAQYTGRYTPGTEFEVELVRRNNRRIDPMRKWYFAAVLPPFMEHLGYEPEETLDFHKQLKIVFFQVQPDAKGMHRHKDIPSVFSDGSELEIEQKKAFLDWVIRKAAQEGVYIDDPQS